MSLLMFISLFDVTMCYGPLITLSVLLLESDIESQGERAAAFICEAAVIIYYVICAITFLPMCT